MLYINLPKVLHRIFAILPGFTDNYFCLIVSFSITGNALLPEFATRLITMAVEGKIAREMVVRTERLPWTRLPGTPLSLIVLAVILMLVILVFVPFQPEQPPVPAESLIIASGSPEFSALTLVADKKGFFARHGLNVTIKDFSTGLLAVNELFAGTADLASAAEFVGVTKSYSAPDLRIIASTAQIDAIAIVIRGDRGITSPADLRGKTIAVPRGTQAEFFLGKYLMLNGIEYHDIEVQNLQPAQLIGSVINGTSDGAIIWEPYVYTLEKSLGPNGMTWPAQVGQRFYWITYTRSDVLEKRPGSLIRYLQALIDAEDYVYDHKDDAKTILKERINRTGEYIDRLWEKNRYLVSLDQGLVLTMEEEVRWMKANNLTGGKEPPSCLTVISPKALLEVRPESVTIIQ
jgi:NitT/TauT family transport system substrate-binding protein